MRPDPRPARPPWRPARRACALLTLILAVAALGPTIGLITPSGWAGEDASRPLPTATATVETAPRAVPPGTLPAMLGLAPDRLADDVPLADIAAYADIAAATRGHGLARPTSLADPGLPAWEAGLAALALPPALAARGLDPSWQTTYGFTLLDLHQVLTVGPAPDAATILHGDFTAAALTDTWVRNGYQAVETEGVTVWSLFPGDTIDLFSPASRPALGSLNNVYLLDERTLVAAPTLAILRDVLRVAAGQAPSLAERPAVGALLQPTAVVESLVSAMLLKGQLLQAARPDAAPATPTPAMPRVELALVGLLPPGHATGPLLDGPQAAATPNAVPVSRMVTLLAFDDAAAAADAVSLIQRRLAVDISTVSGQPHTARVQPVRVRVIEEEPAVLVELGLHRGEADWRRIVDDRDLGPMMWTDDDAAD